MLTEFIVAHREDLIARTRAKVAKRLAPRATELELATGVPLFLDQLVETLRRPPTHAHEFERDAMDRSAAVHGARLLGRGYTIAQVVHDYGDICQAITGLAGEVDAPISIDEFHTLNSCLDNAIAEAVTAYAQHRDESIAAREVERSGVFAHELRNKLTSVQLGFQAIKSGRAPVSGSVAAVVTRSLEGMTALIHGALVEVRLDSGSTRLQRIPLHGLIEDAEVQGMLEAGIHGVSLSVTPTDRTVDVYADREVLAGAVANVLQNALKFTHAGGQVAVRTFARGGRVEIEIEDECGGLPSGKAEELFGAFQQCGADRSGLGLGLFICRRGVEASGGQVRVRDVPGRGCVFTIDLPQMLAGTNGAVAGVHDCDR
jgi:hypothetical protein